MGLNRAGAPPGPTSPGTPAATDSERAAGTSAAASSPAPTRKRELVASLTTDARAGSIAAQQKATGAGLQRVSANRGLSPLRELDARLGAGEVAGLYYRDQFGKKVALTFDDGPHPVNTPKVLDILAKYGVKATFFVTGNGARKYPDLVRRIVAEGHTLGNHTLDHPDLSRLSKAKVEKQFADTQAAVDAALGCHHELSLYRPPYGAMNESTRDVVRERGGAMLIWRVDSNDWRHRSEPEKIMTEVFGGSGGVTAGGGVILFHDIHPQTVQMLGDVLERLHGDGFEVYPATDLLEQKYGIDFNGDGVVGPQRRGVS